VPLVAAVRKNDGVASADVTTRRCDGCHVWHSLAMDGEDALRCLAEADAGQLRPDLCDGRYVALSYSPDETFAAEATSVYAAFDLLAEHLASGEDPAELMTRVADFNPGIIDQLREKGITSSSRQLVAVALVDAEGLVEIVTEEHWRDPYLGEELVKYPGARFILLASAVPHYQDFAVGILELQPTAHTNP
jgi:hypothetical protein